MSAYIRHIERAVPEYEYDQDYTLSFMKEFVKGDRITPRVLHRIYTQSGIEKRHSVLPDFKTPMDYNGEFLTKDSNGDLRTPGTKVRNAIYTRGAKSLLTEVVSTALENSGVQADEITHLVTISCTGFFAPGPDYHIIRTCGLPTTVERTHIGFMGCFAAFQGLKQAKYIVESQPSAKVLIADIELCTVHLSFENSTDLLISGSVFADGAAAVIVEGEDSETQNRKIALDGFRSDITDNGEEDMAWTIGDHGFEMKLSTYVPTILEKNMAEVVQNLLDQYELSTSDIDHWPIHPGGRAILDKIQSSLDLSDDDLISSREVLKNYGNMSSVTILFVLHHMLEQNHTGRAFASAFGPGLTVESGLITLL